MAHCNRIGNLDMTTLKFDMKKYKLACTEARIHAADVAKYSTNKNAFKWTHRSDLIEFFEQANAVEVVPAELTEDDLRGDMQMCTMHVPFQYRPSDRQLGYLAALAFKAGTRRWTGEKLTKTLASRYISTFLEA